MPLRLLLGPQRPFANLGKAMRESGVPEGPLAVVSAGWQEAEGDIDDVRELAGRELNDLRLYQRAEALFAADPALHEAYRRRQDRLIELQRLYRLRLRQLMIAARQVLRARGDADTVAAEVRHAVSQLRALDRHHAHRVAAIHTEFDAACNQPASGALQEHMAAVAEALAAHPGVIITGGNVLVLINRLRLFGVHDLLADKHLVAWSAGAMVLGSTVVLFHDRTPQGRRDPEVLGPGLGLVPGHVFLPDAARRLRLNDRVRLDLLQRRFAPDTCVTLDSGAHLHLEDGIVRSFELARAVRSGGRLQRIDKT